MKNSILINLSLMAFAILALSACKKEEQKINPPPPENEFLTTIIFTAINTADSTDVRIARWRDLTPGDANPPTQIDTLFLLSNTDYYCTIELLDETIVPAGDIGADVSDARNFHIFCYETSSLSSSFNIISTDLDNNTPAIPFGMETRITSGTFANGEMQIELRHQPAGKDGTCNPGTIDFQISLPVFVN